MLHKMNTGRAQDSFPHLEKKQKEKEQRKQNQTGVHETTTLKTELLFVLHVMVIIIIVIIAIYAPLAATIVLLLVHRAMFIYFEGCILNQCERYVSDNPRYQFFQELAFRITGIIPDKITGKKISITTDYILVTTVLLIAIAVFISKTKSAKRKLKNTIK